MALSDGEIADVNGYYRLLGLPASRGVTDLRVRRAIRALQYELHPDRGEYDPTLWQALEAAAGVLKDPRKRAVYDGLVPPLRWVDAAVLAEWSLRGVSGHKEAYGGAWAYYLEDGVALPEAADRWLCMASYAWRELGVPDLVRLGFGRRYEWELRSWGQIFFVPAGCSPDMEKLVFHMEGGYTMRGARCTFSWHLLDASGNGMARKPEM